MNLAYANTTFTLQQRYKIAEKLINIANRHIKNAELHFDKYLVRFTDWGQENRNLFIGKIKIFGVERIASFEIEIETTEYQFRGKTADEIYEYIIGIDADKPPKMPIKLIVKMGTREHPLFAVNPILRFDFSKIRHKRNGGVKYWPIQIY